jgi:hypothetical protein
MSHRFSVFLFQNDTVLVVNPKYPKTYFRKIRYPLRTEYLHRLAFLSLIILSSSVLGMTRLEKIFLLLILFTEMSVLIQISENVTPLISKYSRLSFTDKFDALKSMARTSC